MEGLLLKVAIVGCGKIADSHASAIRRVPGCEIVAVCDNEPLMAQQARERFSVPRCFSDFPELLAAAKPDVVHVTTPPASHFNIAKLCLESGCHVYVEKPFTLYQEEARKLIALAGEYGLKITVGHDDQFRHGARRMRALIESGYLGGDPMHMESYYGYELSSDYAAALLANKQHWVRKLPGKLLQNIISHGIARIAEYLTGDSPEVIVCGYTSPFLRAMGETEIIDELRMIICEDQRVTAYFTFSSQMRPALHQFRVYGCKNGLVLDQDQETVIKLPGSRLKSYAEHFISPVILAKQQLGNVCTNFRCFLGNDFHMKAGMKHLIEAFYRSIVEGSPVPIPYREILLTSRIMDTIFTKLDQQQQLQAQPHDHPALTR